METISKKPFASKSNKFRVGYFLGVVILNALFIRLTAQPRISAHLFPWHAQKHQNWVLIIILHWLIICKFFVWESMRMLEFFSSFYCDVV